MPRRSPRGSCSSPAITSELRTTISPRSPGGSRLPASSITATVTSGLGRPADDSRSRAIDPVGVEVVGRRHRRDHHRRLGLPEQLRHHRTDRTDRLLQPSCRDRRRAVPEALQRDQVGARQVVVAEQHVDQRRRQERVRDPVPLDQLQEVGEVGLRHHHDLAAARHHREAEHPGGVGQRRQREIDRAAVERDSSSASAPTSSRGWRR